MPLTLKPASSSRYSSYDSRSSYFSDPSSSADVKSCALANANPNPKPKPQNLTAMVKSLMSKTKSGGSGSSGSKPAMRLVIPQDAIAQDLKKMARKQGAGKGFGELPRKLFGVNKEKSKEVKALTDLKGNGNGTNARTLAMVLRSERELLSSNKEQEIEIADLKLILDKKNQEVEKLKDLCLRQREEIKSLKSAVLFPDPLNHPLLETRESEELKQAKLIIPALQRQVTSLTGQLQCLAEDLAQVKANKYSAGTPFQHHGSCLTTPTFDDEEAANSLEFSSPEATAPGSPDNLFLKDLNPCLTPRSTKIKSNELEAANYDSPGYDDDDVYSMNKQAYKGTIYNSYDKTLSKSSDTYQNSAESCTLSGNSQRSDDGSNRTYRMRKPLHHRVL